LIGVALARLFDQRDPAMPITTTALHTLSRPALRWGLSALVAAALTACGGGEPAATSAPQEAATGAVALQVAVDTPDAAGALVAQPSFHAAPLLLDEPDGREARDHEGAARTRPSQQALSARAAGMDTRGLTPELIEESLRRRAAAGSDSAAPMAGTGTVSTYSPAQIRAAYALPTLPALGATLTAAQAAQLGAGQTIYIVNAKHNPNVAAELAAFNAKFGLPNCTTTTLAATAKLPLAAASSSACELVLAYSSTAGALSATAPAYDSGWATEIALDVQWAHATAPLARLVLIEAPDASVTSLSNAVKLANSMGAGVVSMSFGAAEGSWTSTYDTAFSGTNMSYVAATGDNGAAVSWPAVSSKVLAVSGTSLTYTGTGARSEVTWTGTGGGVSAYVALPSYQISGITGATKRSVADVSFNADPSTGQYVAVIASGTTTPKWISAGGTSLSTPQWAGLLAVANAVRAQAGKAPLGQPHAALYSQIAAVPGTYAATFADVNKGSNGTCTSCTAKAGYDTPTGWGTPNASALLSSLSGATVTAPTPTPAPTPAPTPTPVTSGPKITTTSLSGVATKAFSGLIAYTAPGATSLSISVTGVPSGMSFAASATGLSASWAKPVVGSYNLAVKVTDNIGKSASATVVVKITAQ
jgi:subtilase family serine protease